MPGSTVTGPTDNAGATLSPAAERRHELGGFLRTRRERITPEQVGLPAGGRRRTPGLRREEVAQLAGVGVTWYTWLEQGRDIQASAQVLEAIARTLRMDLHERSHLFTLAGVAIQATKADCGVVSAGIRLMLDQLAPYPAVVTNSRFDVLAYNATYGHLIADLSTIPSDDRNTLWLAFTDPRWRAGLPDWEDGTARIVAQFRSAMAAHVGEADWRNLVNRLLAASPEFRALWERHDVQGVENQTKRFLNPQVGLLRMEYHHLWFGPRQSARLTTYTPVDEVTEQRLHQLDRALAA